MLLLTRDSFAVFAMYVMKTILNLGDVFMTTLERVIIMVTCIIHLRKSVSKALEILRQRRWERWLEKMHRELELEQSNNSGEDESED